MKTRLKKSDPRQKSTAYIYQAENRCVAQVAEDLSEAGAAELASLGATDIAPEFRAIHFTAEKPVLYRINYMSRLLSRVLAPLITFDCPRPEILYQQARTIPWKQFFLKNRTFAVFADVSSSAVNHSQYAALSLKDAIVDYFTEETGRPRPEVNKMQPDISLHLHIHNNRATISLDTSGPPLHKRGYREETVAAPMQETIAAGIIHFSGWDGSRPLYDPLCGSGTLLCEALMHYCRIPAGIFRERFGLEVLPDFDPAVWRQIKQTADADIRELPEGLLAGSDIAADAVRSARTNLMGLHSGSRVTITQQDFRDLPGLENRLIVTNPPYGIRLEKDGDLKIFYRDLGNFFKKKCRGATAFLYLGDRSHLKSVGLKPTWKQPLRTGGLDGRLVRYDLY